MVRQTRKDIENLKKLLVSLQNPVTPTSCSLSGNSRSGLPPRPPSHTTSQWPNPRSQKTPHQVQESSALEEFSLKYHAERQFTAQNYELYLKIFKALVQRLDNNEWRENAPAENILRVFVCLRVIMRDNKFREHFGQMGGNALLTSYIQKAADSYGVYGDGPFIVEILSEITNIVQKITKVPSQREGLIDCGIHKSLVILLSANDIVVLHCSLHALCSLVQSPMARDAISRLNFMEVLLMIIQEYDILSKKLAANFLRFLCGNSLVKQMVQLYDGIPILLSVLENNSVTLLWQIVWCLCQLANTEECSNDIRQMGGIPILLSLLHDRQFITERAAANLSSTSPVNKFNNVNEELHEHILSLKQACCAAITELVVNDRNAQHVVQANGIYLLCKLILPPSSISDTAPKLAMIMLQAQAFRSLRFLFSMERNRRLFKQIFPPDIFEMFISIGHYKHDIQAYLNLVDKVNDLSSEVKDEMLDSIQACNQNKPASRYICDYAILELLGAGAFGSVYKVKKKAAGQSFLAMKEISAPALGNSAKDQRKSVDEIVMELTIIREQLKHPNVVKYYKTFIECDRLYIVMELIDGAPLGEHFMSLKEKGEFFSEDRVWRIFIQMVLALRYLHKEKRIIHRDLTPNNIMLGENDKVTITDFGLAKQKQKDASRMMSMVGTILYSCPEIVQNQPYGEKADIWAIGCILYQICTLNPPFYSNNMLSLATNIVKAEYNPIPKGRYSERIINTIQLCINPDPNLRPDIVQVASYITDVILEHMDIMQREQINIEKKLEQEKRRTQNYFADTSRKLQRKHDQLFNLSQERYEKLINLASSGGGQSMKGETEEDLNASSDRGWMLSDDELTCSRDSSSSEGKQARLNYKQIERPRSGSVSSRKTDRPKSGKYSKLTPQRMNSEPNHKSSIYQTNIDYYSEQLMLEIPSKGSHDSGLSSCDPSPGFGSSPVFMVGSIGSDDDSEVEQSFKRIQRSVSSNSVDSTRSEGKKPRPNSAGKSTLTISPHKVRQISDPIQQMLHALHKLVYISQLPPSLCQNPRRRVIERFKRALFVPQSSSDNLKSELKRLLLQSREVIDLNFGPANEAMLRQFSQDERSRQSSMSDASNVYDTEAEDIGVTYEQMHSLIEAVLVESGYYSMNTTISPSSIPINTVEAFLSKHGKEGM